MADPPKAPASGFGMGLENILDGLTKGEICEAHDAGDRRAGTLLAVLGDLRDELGFPHRPMTFRPVRSVLGGTFDEDGLDHVVGCAGVGVQLFE